MGQFFKIQIFTKLQNCIIKLHSELFLTDMNTCRLTVMPSNISGTGGNCCPQTSFSGSRDTMAAILLFVRQLLFCNQILMLACILRNRLFCTISTYMLNLFFSFECFFLYLPFIFLFDCISTCFFYKFRNSFEIVYSFQRLCIRL